MMLLSDACAQTHCTGKNRHKTADTPTIAHVRQRRKEKAEAALYPPNGLLKGEDVWQCLNAQAETTTPNVRQGTDDAMLRPETDETQPRQTGTGDDRNA
jgi:hypothetical protein